MSATLKCFTLLEFTKEKLPDRWARYAQLRAAPSMQGLLVFVNLLHHEGRKSLDQVASQHHAIVEDLKKLLPEHKLVADDASGRTVTLNRRHWADATFEIEKSAIQHGKQRWTNVEVRERAQGASQASMPVPSQEMKQFLRRLGGGSSVPAKKMAFDRARQQFSEYHVTRRQVDEEHKSVFGKQRPGKRKPVYSSK